MDKWTAAPRLTTSPQAQQQQKPSIHLVHKPVNYIATKITRPQKQRIRAGLDRHQHSIDAEDIRGRFERITDNHGWSAANRVISLLRSLYRKPCADIEALHNPVSLWLAEGGRFHAKPRREISTPTDVLPRWRAGIEAEVDNAVIRDALYFAMYTGLLREEVLTLNVQRHRT